MAEASFIARLQEEIDAWQREGLVSPQQASRILARYGLAPEHVGQVQNRGRLAVIAGTLGAVLVGVGLVLFVASNWQSLERGYEVLLLLTALVALYAAGYWLKFGRGHHPRIGAALIFFGAVLFGASVFLIADIYHVASGEPLLPALWAAGAFAVGFVTISRPSLFLAILATLMWFVFQLNAWQFDRLGPPGLIGLAAFLSLGLLLLSLGELLGGFRRTSIFATLFVWVGLAVSLLLLLAWSSAGFWLSFASIGGDSPLAGQPATLIQLTVTFGVFCVLALVLTVAATWRSGLSRTSLTEGIGVLLLIASSLPVVFHVLNTPGGYAVAYSLVLLAAILWAVTVGVWTRREAFVNIALVFFVLLVAARYFDSFFTLLDRSLALICAGALLLGVGYLIETSRRRLLRGMRAGGEEVVDVE